MAISPTADGERQMNDHRWLTHFLGRLRLDDLAPAVRS
jgi:hypothetical protein